jgi:hypothetical protein
MRPATLPDLAALRLLGATTLSHPDGKGRKEGHRGSTQRGELLLLERYDGRLHDWRIAAFVDWHIRVDDVLTIRDVGTEGERPHSGMVKQLVMELIRSLSPVEATLKVRADAGEWNEIVQSIAGFALEGSEYRRPHWINVWRWTREAEAQAARTARGPRFRR